MKNKKQSQNHDTIITNPVLGIDTRIRKVSNAMLLGENDRFYLLSYLCLYVFIYSSVPGFDLQKTGLKTFKYLHKHLFSMLPLQRCSVCMYFDLLVYFIDGSFLHFEIHLLHGMADNINTKLMDSSRSVGFQCPTKI